MAIALYCNLKDRKSTGSRKGTRLNLDEAKSLEERKEKLVSVEAFSTSSRDLEIRIIIDNVYKAN